MKADQFVEAAKWTAILAVGGLAAVVAWKVYKTGAAVGDAIGETWDEMKAKVAGAVEYVKDPSQGRSYGSALDLAERQRDPLSPDYVPDWRKRAGVTVNAYGDYGYGGEVDLANSQSELNPYLGLEP